MLSQSTIQRYFEALSTHNGALAASLFTENGVIDDFRGKHHAGRKTIEAFINQVPELTLDFKSDFIEEPPRITAYGHIINPGKEPVLVRWVFSAGADDKIAHLSNSRIEQVPAERQKKRAQA